MVPGLLRLLSAGSPDLPRESSLWDLVTVLCCNPDLCIQLLTGKVEVDGGGSTNHLWKATGGAVVSPETGKGQQAHRGAALKPCARRSPRSPPPAPGKAQPAHARWGTLCRGNVSALR